MSLNPLLTRRRLLQTGAAAAAASALPRLAHARARQTIGLAGAPLGTLADPATVRALAMRALDAARAAGAQYADVRLTRIIGQQYRVLTSSPYDQSPLDEEQLAIGVRAQVNGCWGFAASPYWTADDVTALATEAAHQATMNARAVPRTPHWVPAPAVTGDWSTPGVIDPFDVPPEEKLEHLQSMVDYVATASRKAAPSAPLVNKAKSCESAWANVAFTRCEWALATTEGTYCTQRTYYVDWQDAAMGCNDISFDVSKSVYNTITSVLPIVPTDWIAGGWEQCAVEPRRAQIDRTLEAFFRNSAELIPQGRPVELGRYDIVCVPSVVRSLLSYTVTSAFELDRVLGYEANAGGTSWISDPLTTLGTQVGSPLVTITGNRSAPGQLATVQWDDEGVAPEEVTVMKQGVINDFWTTREMAGWLEPAYQKRGSPIRSHGCAASGSALDFPLVHPPNVVLHPSAESTQFEDLVTSTKRGIAIFGGAAITDFQAMSGAFNATNVAVQPNAREIVNGRLGRRVENVGFLFQASELWKNVSAIGGATSVETSGMISKKGQPEQHAMFTVSAVPIKVSGVPIVNMERL